MLYSVGKLSYWLIYWNPLMILQSSASLYKIGKRWAIHLWQGWVNEFINQRDNVI